MTTTQTTATRSPLHPVLTARRLNQLDRINLREATDLGLVRLWIELDNLLDAAAGDLELYRLRQRMDYRQKLVEREQLRRQP